MTTTELHINLVLTRVTLLSIRQPRNISLPNFLLPAIIGVLFMMTFSSVTMFLCSLCITALSIWIWQLMTSGGRRRLPPGPKGFAAVSFLVGCLKNGLEEESSSLMRRLGTDLISIDLFGLKTIVVFASQEKLTDAYQKKGDLLLRRPTNPSKPGTVGLLSGYGRVWREQRRFALITLRNLGMGKDGAQQRILDEVQSLIGLLESKGGKPLDPSNPIGIAIMNVISSVVFSCRFDHGDPDLAVMLENFNNLASGSHVRPLVTLAMFDNFFELPGIKTKITEQRLKTDISRRLLKGRVEAAANHDTGDGVDFVAAYMAEIKRRENDPETSFTETQLIDVVEDLFGAGSETTSTTLRWGLLLMAHYPDVQCAVYDELREKITAVRVPVYSDRQQTPYVDAVLLEIQRYASMVPIIRRRNDEPVELFGYNFHRNTNFCANLWHMNRDQAIWQKPYEFFPGHFINVNGELMNKESFNPFGLGKRQCLGESLARMELYLFFTSIVLNFRIQAPDGEDLPKPSKASVGLIRAPMPYNICFVPREQG